MITSILALTAVITTGLIKGVSKSQSLSCVKITVRLRVKLITAKRSRSLLEMNRIGAETPFAPEVRRCVFG